MEKQNSQQNSRWDYDRGLINAKTLDKDPDGAHMAARISKGRTENKNTEDFEYLIV